MRQQSNYVRMSLQEIYFFLDEPQCRTFDYTWSSDNTTLTLTFASALYSYIQYIVMINTNVQDEGYYIEASDGTPYYTGGNHLKKLYIFSFRTRDIIPPEIINISATPSAQEVHSYVNITAFVLDNVMVNGVYVNIAYPNGTLFGNFSMTGIELDANRNGTYCYNTTYSVLGTYSYHIWANDTSNNQNKSATYTFLIRDTTKPSITNVQATPASQIVGGYANITCTVTDNVAVNIVKVNIVGPAGFTPVNITMLRIAGTNNYYYNATYSIKGIYYYYVWANDTSDNHNKSITYQFEIDITKLEITNIQSNPSVQEVYGYVNITCTVTDNIGVNIVNVTITDPNGEITNISMKKLNGNIYYHNTSYSILGIYSYYIWANDTSNNQNVSAVKTFTIQDTTRLVISNIQATPPIQAQNRYVNITCTVIDNVRVSIVNVSITGPVDFTPVNITMARITGTDNCYYNFTYPIAGEYSYYIWAVDTSGNRNRSAEYKFTITIAVTTLINGREINIVGIGNGTVNVTSVSLPQPPPENLHNITCIEVTITGTLTYINITIRYTEEDVAGLDEGTLKMYYWTGTEWAVCPNTGVDTENKFVWANVTHLTIFAPMAEKVAEAPAPVNWLLYTGIMAIVVILAVSFVVVKKRKKLEGAK